MAQQPCKVYSALCLGSCCEDLTLCCVVAHVKLPSDLRYLQILITTSYLLESGVIMKSTEKVTLLIVMSCHAISKNVGV